MPEHLDYVYAGLWSSLLLPIDQDISKHSTGAHYGVTVMRYVFVDQATFSEMVLYS